jgi:hypothetical protein
MAVQASSAGPDDDRFVAYSGRYTVVGDQVVHHVALSVKPRQPGDQIRTAGFEGAILVMTATGGLAGEVLESQWRWARAEGPEAWED